MTHLRTTRTLQRTHVRFLRSPTAEKEIASRACRRRRPRLRAAIRRGEPLLFRPSRAVRALDWFVFFLADVQTGFGAFVSVYLTTAKMDPNRYWSRPDGSALSSAWSVKSRAARLSTRRARSAGWRLWPSPLSVISAFALAVSPIFVVVFASRILQAGASCVLGPAIAAISLGLVGQRGDQHAPGSQRGFRFSRLRPRRRGHGRFCILHFRSRGLYSRGEHDRAGAVRPLLHTNARNRS